MEVLGEAGIDGFFCGCELQVVERIYAVVWRVVQASVCSSKRKSAERFHEEDVCSGLEAGLVDSLSKYVNWQVNTKTLNQYRYPPGREAAPRPILASHVPSHRFPSTILARKQ